MGYLVTNFAYGIGPYLRTTELALAFNNELMRRGRARISVIVPWVYGGKQKKIMSENFGAHAALYPDEILLDAKLGRILKQVFYTGDRRYAETPLAWVESAERVSNEAGEHLSSTFEVETLSGEKKAVNGRDIVLEINRSPRIRYGVAPSYSTTFGYIAEILERAHAAGRKAIDVDPEALQKGTALADIIEGRQEINCMAYPATFSWRRDYQPRYKGEVLVPPITDLPPKSDGPLDEGIYVTITGIEGLERLYGEARALGLKLYSNDTKAVEGAVKILPEVIPNPAIKFQFARSGWGSVWLSMFCGTPIVVPEFDPTDDPEIYFNNIAIEEMGIGIIYRGQPLRSILAETEHVRQKQKEMREAILKRWGTLNGNEVCAKLFADKFLAG